MDWKQIVSAVDRLKSFIDAYGAYLFFALLLINLLAIAWIFSLKRKIHRIFQGDKSDMEEVLLGLRDHQEIADRSFAELQKKVKNLEEELPKGIRRFGLVRFNPFSDAGGDQSFSLALLNDDKDGVIISSLYGREINRVYSKPIKNGKSQYQLTAEEKQAIENAFL